MSFPPHILDEIRARLPVSHVVGRRVALKRAGREMRGLSPFKVERTPSFFVNDHKGFYHCFASGEHGDVFKFLMVTEGLSFPEAVERLAKEAGVVLPERSRLDPVEIKVEQDRRERLAALMTAAVEFFRGRLASAEGSAARAYLAKRGLQQQTLARFHIGFAPASHGACRQHLGDVGFTIEEMIATGMLIGGPDIQNPYDRFRNRVMFPIEDAKGRVIAFGGRALDPDAPAKYLNSPETELFHKGDVLFNAQRARQTAHERSQIIAVEGYMDAIALDQAGFSNVVAPLGTALTERQLALLWRMAKEPVLCFDGDAAGRRAAWRAIDVALPHLVPGSSLSIAFLPDGVDPDDLVRLQGAAAFQSVLASTRPLFDVLWEREWSAGSWTTPERRAHLEKRLAGLITTIADRDVRGHYQRAVRDRFFQAWRGERVGAPRFERGGAPSTGVHRGPGPAGRPREHRGFASTPSRSPKSGWQRGGLGVHGHSGATIGDSLRQSRLVVTSATPPYREALLAMTLVNHPWLAAERAEEVASLELTSPPLARLRDELLGLVASDFSLDSAAIRHQLSHSGSDSAVTLAERAITHRCDKFAQPGSERAEVEAGWGNAVLLHKRHVDLKRALASAEHEWHRDASEEAFARIAELRGLLDTETSPEESVVTL